MRQGLLLICACTALICAAIIPLKQAHARVTMDEVASIKSPPPTAHIPYGTQPDQYGDIWVPEGKGPFKVVVVIHGGCWFLPKIAPLMNAVSDDLRKSGFAVWNVEYRALGTQGAGYPGTFMDIANAVDFLRELARTYPLDLSSVVVLGHSAGGHLALWAAARDKIPPESALYTPNPLPVRAAFSMAGVPDLRAFSEHSATCGQPVTIYRLVGASKRTGQDIFADTSPAEMLPIKAQQMIYTGDKDDIVATAFGKDYVDMAQKTGTHAVFTHFPNAGHFEFISPTSAEWQVIKQDIRKTLP